MRTTRTHTAFWSEEQLAPLNAHIGELVKDWAERREYVPAELRIAGDVRVSLLRAAMTLAAEDAD